MKNNTDRQPLYKRFQILDGLGHQKISWHTADGEEVTCGYLGYSEEEGYPINGGNVKTYMSISDFLEAHGYKADSAEGYYIKRGKPRDMYIHPLQWQGLTVYAFIQKAREKGWVEDEGTQPQGWREETEVHLPGGLYIPRALVYDGPLHDEEEKSRLISYVNIPICLELDDEPAQHDEQIAKPFFAVEDPERQEEVFRLSDFYPKKEERSVEDLQLEIASLKKELNLDYLKLAKLNRSLKFANLDLGEFGKLLNMIPLCPTHRNHCLHYAQEWVEKMKEQATEAHLVFPAVSPHSFVIEDVRQILTIEFSDDCYGKNIPLYWQLQNDFYAKRRSHFSYEGKEYDLLVIAMDEETRGDLKILRFTLHKENKKDSHV